MTFGSLFSGIGGMDLGLERAGMTCKWQVEWAEYPRRVLAKHWPNVKRYGDIREVDGGKLEPVDLVCGGFPCEDISLASATGAGIVGARSGLWSEFARILREVRPRFAFIENVPALRNRGLALVLQNLWALGFDAEWHCIPASALGAHHERDRIFITAYPAGMFREAIIWGEPYRDVQDVSEDADAESDGCGQGRTWRPDSGYSWQREQAFQNADSDGSRELQPQGALEEFRGRIGDSPCSGLAAYFDGVRRNGRAGELGQGWRPESSDGSTDADAYSEPLVGAAIARGERSAWTVEPGVVRMVHGIAYRVDRVAGLGRVVVPQVAEWIGKRILAALTASTGPATKTGDQS